jgi:hypothetical protein
MSVKNPNRLSMLSLSRGIASRVRKRSSAVVGTVDPGGFVFILDDFVVTSKHPKWTFFANGPKATEKDSTVIANHPSELVKPAFIRGGRVFYEDVPHHGGALQALPHPNTSLEGDDEFAQASDIYDRISSELDTEEARADRLLKLYGLS